MKNNTEFIVPKCVDGMVNHSMTLSVRADGCYCPRCGKRIMTKEQHDKSTAEYNERMGIIK